jgi:hypothetical protein
VSPKGFPLLKVSVELDAAQQPESGQLLILCRFQAQFAEMFGVLGGGQLVQRLHEFVWVRTSLPGRTLGAPKGTDPPSQ